MGIYDFTCNVLSLTNKDNQPCKMKIDPNRHQYGIYCHPECGPTFGYRNADVQISSNSNTNMCYSYLGYNYEHPQYVAGTNETRAFLAGLYKFQLSENEVY